MNREHFEGLVLRAVENLPDEFRERLQNVDIVVEEEPSRRQLQRMDMTKGMALLGLYEGVPQTHRNSSYGLVLPDKITIFKKPVEAACRTDEEIKNTVEGVVKHEIAHHFGISDARLEQIAKGDS